MQGCNHLSILCMDTGSQIANLLMNAELEKLSIVRSINMVLCGQKHFQSLDIICHSSYSVVTFILN